MMVEVVDVKIICPSVKSVYPPLMLMELARMLRDISIDYVPGPIYTL